MKKMCKALALTLCTIMLLSTLTVVGDSGGKTVLTLEEAKQIALDNDVQFKLQQSYIQQKSEDYEDVYDMYKGNPRGTFKSKVDRVTAEVSNKINIENAAFAIRKEIFKRNDLRRASDYNVTTAYYDVMKSKLALDDAKRSMDLAKIDLDVAKLKLQQGLVTINDLAQTENAYVSSQTDYNKAFTDVQNNMATLSRNMGKNLDVFNDEIDMTIITPDIKSLDLNQIKKDYMEKNEGFYLLKEQLDIAEYKQDLTEEKHEHYTEGLENSTSDYKKALDDMLYKANRDYDDARYQLSEKEKELDVTLNTLYTGINTTAESIENLKKSIEDTKTTVEQNKLRYDLGLLSKNAFEKSESALKDLENTLNTTIIALNTQYLTLTQYSYTPEK